MSKLPPGWWILPMALIGVAMWGGIALMFIG